MKRKLLTADGTETYYNEEYREAYHSTKAGAYTESLYKFIYPCKIPELSKTGHIKILDIGFGLGYNVATTIEEAKKSNPDVFIEIFSIEKDKDVFNKIKELNIVDRLKEPYRLILSGEFKDIFLNGKTIPAYVVKEKNVKLTVLLGEGRELLRILSEAGEKFDAVFYDAFSPKVNTEMWTVDLFKVVKSLMKEKAILATYSASLAVRKGLIEAGFKIGLVEPVGRRSHSTVATLKGDIPPLTEKEKKRLKTSPYAIPYRDENLNLPPAEIKRKWEEELEKRLNLRHNLP